MPDDFWTSPAVREAANQFRTEFADKLIENLVARFGAQWHEHSGAAFERAVRTIARKRPDPTDEDRLKFHRYVTNVQKTHLLRVENAYKEGRRIEVGEQPDGAWGSQSFSKLDSREPEPEEPLMRKETADLINSIIAEIKPEYREALQWFFFNEGKGQDLAARIGRAPGAANDRKRRGLVECRKILEGMGYQPGDLIDVSKYNRPSAHGRDQARCSRADPPDEPSEPPTLGLDGSDSWTVVFHQEEDGKHHAVSLRAGAKNPARIVVRWTDSRGNTHELKKLSPSQVRQIADGQGAIRKVEAKSSARARIYVESATSETHPHQLQGHIKG